MMPENDPLVGGDEVLSVVFKHSRRRPAFIDHKNFGYQPLAVKSVADRKGAKACRNEPKRIHRFATMNSKEPECRSAKNGNSQPYKYRKYSFHAERNLGYRASV